MKVGLLGGSFDPVHNGHLYLAEQALGFFNLDEVWWIPARQNPHKIEEPETDASLRLKMVEKAIAPYPNYRLFDLECKKEGPSYTIETIQKLKRDYPEAQFYLLLGSDALEGLSKWKEIDKIFNLTNIVVFVRGEALEAPGLSREQQEWIHSHTINIPIKEVSSTEIRERLALGEDCSHLLPDEILDFIRQNQLYS